MSRIFGKVSSPYSLDQVLQTGNSARDRHLEDVSNIFFSDGGDYQNDTAIISQDITTLFMEINTLDTSVNALAPAYGSFTLNTSIPVSGLNVPTPITYDTTEIASGISFDPINPSHITVAETGVYKLSYSIQFDKSGGGTSQVDIWIAVDGTEVPRSASQGTVTGNNGEVFVMCEYILSLTSSNFVEVYFTSDNDTTMTATAFPAVPLVRPSIPACITNLYRIA